MKRATLASALTVSAIGLLIAGFIFGTSSRTLPGNDKSSFEESVAENETSSEKTDPTASTRVAPQGSEDKSLEDDDVRPNREPDHEARTREWVREETTADVQRNYGLLLEHLDLAPDEKVALLEFLIEDVIANTKTLYSEGIGMPEDERSARIAEIIGDAKLRKLLTLERSLGEYRELSFVQAGLLENGAPLTETQRDDLLQIMIAVREQVDMTRPVHIERGSIESLEYMLDQLDERDRLVLELVPSVLTPKQVEYLFQRNQEYSYRRAAQLDSQKRRRADDPDDDLPLFYPAKRD